MRRIFIMTPPDLSCLGRVGVIGIMTLLFVSLSACITTRSDISSGKVSSGAWISSGKKPKLKEEISQLQQQLASLDLKLKGNEEQFRLLLGRIESLELKATNGASGEKTEVNRIEEIEEALGEVVVRQDQLRDKVEQLSGTSKKFKKVRVTGDFNLAEKYFATGKWANAVQEFQKFREKNPKSGKISMVTYKIGVCFQELGMKGEAQTFFQNTINKFPKSKAAKFSKFRLNKMK